MNFFSCFFITITVFACSEKISSESSSVGRDTNKVAVSATPGTATPLCILSKIGSIKKDPVWNPPAEIYEYEYQGKKVFAISSNCCDFFNTVVDANCTYVCAPSGGFTGRGDGKCSDFFKTAKQVRLVWKDERKKK